MSARPLSNGTAIAVLTMIFFTWGALTSLNDVLIPHLKAVFEMNYAQTMLIQFTFFSTYLLMSVPAGKVVAVAGYKRSIVIGLCVAGVGALTFFPAAKIPSYPLFLFALFVLASGITLLQVSANPYIALLGDAQTASSRLTLAQALNSAGHTLAPLLIGPLILSVAVIGSAELAQMPEAQQTAYRVAQAESVQLPYLGIAAGLFVLALLVVLFRLPALTEATERADHQRHTFGEVLRHRHLRFGVLGIFVYVGAEVAIGSLIVNYLMQPGVMGLEEQSAGNMISYYWGGAMVGRFIGSYFLRLMSPGKILAGVAIGAITLILISINTDGAVSGYSLLAIGLMNSIMFPTIFSLACEGLGPKAADGSGIINIAIFGGAVVPLLTGMLADLSGSLGIALLLPAACYAVIAYFGYYARRPHAALARAAHH